MFVRATSLVFQNLFIYFLIYFILGVTIKRAAKKKRKKNQEAWEKQKINNREIFLLSISHRGRRG